MGPMVVAILQISPGHRGGHGLPRGPELYCRVHQLADERQVRQPLAGDVYIAATSTGLFVLPLYFIGVGDNLWRWAVGLGAVPALIILVLRLIYIDESPIWAAYDQG